MSLYFHRLSLPIMVVILILAQLPQISYAVTRVVQAERNKSMVLTAYEFSILKNSNLSLSKDQIFEKINETGLKKATQLCRIETCGSNPCVKAINATYIIPETTTKELGVWFDKITCSDQEIDEKTDQKLIEALSETISEANGGHLVPIPNACSINYGPLAAGLLKHAGAAALNHFSNKLFESKPDDPLTATFAKTAALAASSIFQGHLTQLGNKDLNYYIQPIPENVKTLQEVETKFKDEKTRFENRIKNKDLYELNIIPLRQMFERVDEEIKTQKFDQTRPNRTSFEDSVSKEKLNSMLKALDYIKTTLDLPTKTKTISEKAGNALVSYFTEEMTYGEKEISALDDLVGLIEYNSNPNKKAVSATMYFEGAPGVGKTTLAKGVAQKLELDRGELSVTPDSTPDQIRKELVKILLRSQSNNPIIVMDEFGDLFSPKNKNNGVINFFKTFLGGTVTYLEIPPPKEEPRMMGMTPNFIVPTYIDASRATFIGTGNFEIPPEQQALASRFTLKVRVKNKPRAEKVEISKKLLQEALQPIRGKGPLLAQEIEMIEKNVDFDEIKKEPGVRVLKQVMEGYGHYLMEQKNGSERKVRLKKPKESEPFNFQKYYTVDNQDKSSDHKDESSNGHTSRNGSLSDEPEVDDEGEPLF